MELTIKILNIVLPPLTYLCLFILSPLISAFKLFGCLKRRVIVENVAGKVVLITGASSGIGEHLAYEYARRGARLALVARREDRLRAVAEKSRQLGSPDVIAIRADVSEVEDCKRFVSETVLHFGQLDHLVNNAGVVQVKMLEEYEDISDAARLMNTNFWGAVYATRFAIPHLKSSKGKLVAISSGAGYVSSSKTSIYGATKAAMINFFETLRMEFGSEIGITIVIPGLIYTEMTTPEILAKAQVEFVPGVSAATCAKTIVNGVSRGERYLVEPSWVGIFFGLKSVCPEFLEWADRLNTKRTEKND